MSASAPKSRSRRTGEPRRVTGSLPPLNNEAAQASRSLQIGQAFLRIDPPATQDARLGQLASTVSDRSAEEQLDRTLDANRNSGDEPPNQPHNEVVAQNRPFAANPNEAANPSEAENPSEPANPGEPEAWLNYHANDLIDRLTHWSDELSVRESNLNAREAIWERQARRLRLQFQETQHELDQLAASLHQERTDLAQQQARLQRTARQLAMASL